MTLPQKIASLIFAGLISACAYAQTPGQPVKPKQLFPGDVLNVYSPDAEGWIITGMAKNGIGFGKRGAASGETYAAQAIIFEMPPMASHDALVDFVKKRIAAMNPPPRFVETSSNYQYTEERSYPCVNVHMVLDDNAAVTPAGKEKLELQVVALYCRHPVQQQLGFFAAYSHRGKTADDQLEGAAKSFIAGVNVPKQ
jgi:hypothetical protein